MNTVLIVDDEAHVTAALQRALRRHFGARLNVLTYTDPLEAIDRARDMACDVVISDLRMLQMDGISFLERFAILQPHAVRIMLTASSDFDNARRAVNQAGVFRYLSKPWDDAELWEHVEAALAQAQEARLQREQAKSWQAHARQPTPQDLEARRLEALEPGITQVRWGPNGEVVMSEWAGLQSDFDKDA